MNSLTTRPALLGLASALTVGLFAGTLLAQSGAAAPPTAPPAAPAAPAAAPVDALDAKFTAADRTPEAVAKAKALLAEVAKAYRDAKTLSDAVTIEVQTPMGPQKESLQLDFGDGSDMRVKITQMTITAFKETLYVEADQFSQEKFVGVPLLKDDKGNVDITKTLDSVAEGFALPLPHLPFRGGGDEASYLKALSAGSLEDVKLAGLRTNDVGNSEILFVGSNGTGVAVVDAKTRLLQSVVVDFAPPNAPPGLGVKIMLGFTPVVADALASPIAFDAKSRKAVKNMEELMMKLSVGDVAPPFELKTASGELVKLADLKDNVVVLDLWATWCGPCRRGLPLVNDFAKWVTENKKAVKVYGVNVWEAQGQDLDAAARTTRANDFWTKQAFTFPTLIDLDDSLANAYGPNGIPTTYIIGKDGKIASIHTGFAADMKDKLVAEVEKLLQ